MQWFYSLNGQRKGPVSATEIVQLVQQGVVLNDTLVWREGMAQWQPYAQVPDAEIKAAPADTGPEDATSAVCVVSGKRYPKREMIQYEGKWISAEHRDEFFQRLREGVAQPGGAVVPGPFGYGGFWKRFAAKFVDGIILGVPSVIINMVLAMILVGQANYFSAPQSKIGFGSLFQAVSMLVGLVIYLGYEIFFIRRYNATPGKMALGLKIVRTDGSSLSVGRIVGRRFAEYLNIITLYIGYIMVGLDSEKRGLHDRICDTRVIRTR